MKNWIKIALTALLMTSTVKAHEQSHEETLLKESMSPDSLVSVLPKDIVGAIKPFLKSCPVLTSENGVLSLIHGRSSADLTTIEKARKLKEFGELQTRIGDYKFTIDGIEYIYMGLGVAADAPKPRPAVLPPGVMPPNPRNLKEILNEYSSSVRLKGILVGLDYKPNPEGPFCLYEGFEKDKYYYHFTIAFRGNNPEFTRYFDHISKGKRTVRPEK